MAGVGAFLITPHALLGSFGFEGAGEDSGTGGFQAEEGGADLEGLIYECERGIYRSRKTSIVLFRWVRLVSLEVGKHCVVGRIEH